MVERLGLVGPEAVVGEMELETGIDRRRSTEPCRTGNQAFDMDHGLLWSTLTLSNTKI